MKRSSFLRIAPTTDRLTVRLTRCKACRRQFIPARPFITWCCEDCGAVVALDLLAKAERVAAKAQQGREAADRKVTRQRIAALKSRAQHLKEAQAAFNSYIRARDEIAGLPCVSCGRFHTGAYDAGHYRSVGAMPALRFSEINCHRQCVPCNQHKGGNIVEYRIGLVKRIGVLSVEWLEQDIHPARKYTIPEAQAIRAKYKLKRKELQA